MQRNKSNYTKSNARSIPSMPAPRPQPPAPLPAGQPLPPIDVYLGRPSNRPSIAPGREEQFQIQRRSNSNLTAAAQPTRPIDAGPNRTSFATPAREAPQSFPFAPNTSRSRNPFRDIFARGEQASRERPVPSVVDRPAFEQPRSIPPQPYEPETFCDDIQVDELDEPVWDLPPPRSQAPQHQQPREPQQHREQPALPRVPKVVQGPPAVPVLLVSRHLSGSPTWSTAISMLSKDQQLRVRFGERTPANPADLSVPASSLAIFFAEPSEPDAQLLERIKTAASRFSTKLVLVSNPAQMARLQLPFSRSGLGVSVVPCLEAGQACDLVKKSSKASVAVASLELGEALPNLSTNPATNPLSPQQQLDLLSRTGGSKQPLTQHQCYVLQDAFGSIANVAKASVKELVAASLDRGTAKRVCGFFGQGGEKKGRVDGMDLAE